MSTRVLYYYERIYIYKYIYIYLFLYNLDEKV